MKNYVITNELRHDIITWFNDIANEASRLTSGNVSHLGATIRGMAMRSSDFIKEFSVGISDMVGKTNSTSNNELKPLDYVLSNDNRDKEWTLCQFSHIDSEGNIVFVGGSYADYNSVIPYVGNEYLLGTCDGV